MNSLSLVRKAACAGSWYEANSKKLSEQLARFLSKANRDITTITRLKGIIGPHAGLQYCGATQSWAYQYVDPKLIKRIILIGPSHRARIQGCALSSFSSFDTPFGGIEVDSTVIQELAKTQGFQMATEQIEEAEHSLELHLPFIKHMMKENKFKLVPIIVGQTNYESEEFYGQILSKYLDDEETLFVISSDFCHWGKRFGFISYDEQYEKVYQSIEQLDRQGMTAIETQKPEVFSKYITETQNTICGRRGIGIFMQAIKNSKNFKALKTKFVNYSQSSKVVDQNDSSVSYASAVCYL